jgi:hypothetical protein
MAMTRNSILGRDKRTPAYGPSQDGLALLQRQLASADPMLRKLAQEATVCRNELGGTTGADSGGSRPRIRDDLAHHSDLISLGVPR